MLSLLLANTSVVGWSTGRGFGRGELLRTFADFAPRLGAGPRAIAGTTTRM